MTVQANPYIVTSGLVLNLDAANPRSYSGSGTNWYDVSGNNNNGVLTNGPTFTNSNENSYFTFDGVNDYVVIPNGFTNLLKNRSTWTFSIWLRVSAYGAGNDAAPVIFSINDVGNYNEFFLEISSSIVYLSAGGILKSANTTVSTNTIYNINWVLDGSNCYVYLNNSQILSATGMNAMSNVDGDIWIGRFKNSDYDFNGRIYNCQCYSIALTPDQISSNFNAMRGRFNI